MNGQEQGHTSKVAQMLRLTAGETVALVDPAVGAGVVALSDGGIAILSTAEGRDAGSPFAQGMNLLAPFSNRISRPFPFGGAHHAVPPNLPHERFAIHGDAFQKSWEVAEATPERARLTLRGGIGPFVYDASLTYAVAPGRLDTRLILTNRAGESLPYGGGFHPWFPRHAATRLAFGASGYWPEDAQNIPTTTTPVAAPPDWVFAPEAPLPARFINAGFAGWDGTATIRQPDHTLTVVAQGCGTALVYSPGPDAPFFCFEPVSHPVDAHNLPGQPGLTILAPGQSLTLSLRLAWTHTPEETP